MIYSDNSKLSNGYLNNLLKRLNIATTIANGRVKGKIDPNIKHSS